MKNGKDHVLIVFILLSIVYLTSAVLLPQQNDFFTDLQTLNPRYQPQRHANLDINDPCTWQEVTCENNGNYSVVTELRVSIQLVPDSIGNLTSLRSLIMRGEVGLRYLPATISNFKDTLQVLELANTGFTDESIRSILVFNRLTRLVLSGILPLRNLPRGFSSSFPLLETLILPSGIRLLPVTYNLQNLRRLIAPGYVGEVDEENVCGLPNLEVLSLAEYNGRSRQLPDCVGGLRSLILLDLTGSMFTRFPNIWTLDKLEELYMQRSYLIGNIPNEIGRLRSLKILNIENANFLVGTLPASIGGLTNLEIFNVATNRVNGSIPASFGNLRQLRVLNLDNNIMGGAIPSELGNCASLTDFIIGNNAFSGTLPSELGNIASMQNFFVRNNLLTGQLPETFGNWTDLVIFSVQNNQFTGTIPDDYSKWSRLMTMQLDNNQFSGQFPEGFANMNDIITFSASFNNFEGPLFDFTGCRNLQTFQVQFNALQGTIPQALDTLVSLTSLQLQSNQLEGTIPATITRLIQLSEINFGNNKLSGTIPIGLLDRARIIDLSHNMLEGTLPINQTISAAMLMLEHNRLTGQIPDIQASSMDLIDLSHNFFSGTLPQLPARLTSISLASNQISGTFNGQYLRFALLSMLDLSNNLIEGRLPEFPPESTLRHFDISYNSMRGQIPASMITRSIQNIILSHNDFTGPLPTFAPFTNLHTLRVDNNGLSGGIGQALFTGTLEVLDLSTNLFGGMFPTITSRPRRLRELRLHQNFFTGIIPPSLASMISLEVLDLSFNAFVGQIPPQLEALRNLRVLDVSFNRLTGVIPQTLVNLLNLETLNLERNRIEGSIPQYLGDIFSLHYLSLAGNLFTGEIPSMFDSLRSINGLDLSRNRLSGTIPHSLFSLQRVRRIDLSHNSLTGTVSRQIANLRALEDLDLSLNQLSGTIPSLANLRNVISINITGNAFSGCLQLPDQFKVSTNSTARCSIGSNQFCCSLASYSCEVTDKCPINDMLRVPKGSTVDLHDADHFEKLVLDDGGTLVVQHNNRIDIECIDARGTIAIDMSEYEESHLETTFLFYTCGSTEDLNIVAKGKECTITTSVSERAGKLALSASLTCPDTSAAQGVIIAIVISVTGGCILFIVIGAVTYRYFRGKRRVEQLLNRVELLTLTTKNGSDDQFSLPQWHAPEDYSLKPVEDLPIQLTNTKFDFGTKGNLLQVDSMYKDTFRVQNRAKLTQSRGLVERLLEKSLRVNFHPVQSTKYQLTIDPFEIDIRDKGYVDVTLMLQMKMTTRTNISLWVEVPELKQFSLLEFVCASEPSPWIDIDEVDGITEALGEGGFGAVYKAKYRGQTIAFKKLKFQDMNIQQFEEFNREVQMMMNLHHRCIVQFIGASKVPGKLAILTEFVSGGNLQELLNSRPSLDTGLKLKIALDVAEALQFLHANNILHRDIKAENVLVASTAKEASVNVKLTDFGTARSIVEEVTMKFTKGIGTPTYMAPEILDNKRYERSADIYSFGILLWVIMTQQTPYIEVVNSWDIARMVLEGKRLPIPGSVSIVIKELIEKCWAQVPSDRPSIDQVVQQLNLILSTKM